jgi:hypothetical protein
MGRPGLLSSISRGCPDGGNCIEKVFIILCKTEKTTYFEEIRIIFLSLLKCKLELNDSDPDPNSKSGSRSNSHICF